MNDLWGGVQQALGLDADNLSVMQMSALRLEARVTDLTEVKEARLERGGDISVIRSEQKGE